MANPTWGYRMVKGEIESRLFPDGLEKGWKDSPAKCTPKKKSDD